MASFSDNFNRADGSLGANWETLTGSSELVIFSNIVRSDTAGPRSAAAVSTATASFTADHEAQCVFVALGSNDYAGPGVRMSAAGGTGYVLRSDGGNAGGRRIHRYDNNTITSIGLVNVPLIANDVVRLRASGSLISVYVNDVLIDSVTDTTYTTGQPGLFYDFQNNRATQLDNFYATDLGDAPPPPSPGEGNSFSNSRQPGVGRFFIVNQVNNGHRVTITR